LVSRWMIIGAFAFGFSLALSKSMSAPGPKPKSRRIAVTSAIARQRTLFDVTNESEKCQQETLTDRRGYGHRVFLYTRPSFMMTLKFLAGSAIRLIFSSGLPSTSSRSASAPCSTTPSLPGYGLRLPDNASSSALVPCYAKSARLSVPAPFRPRWASGKSGHGPPCGQKRK
jgi:hypothetical protein